MERLYCNSLVIRGSLRRFDMNAVDKAKYVRRANSSPVISLKSNPSEVEFHKGMHCQFAAVPEPKPSDAA